MTHFISIADCSTADLRHMLDVSAKLKKQYKTTRRNDPILAGKTLAMVFEKPSLRTRVSFAVAMTHLGGEGLLLRNEEVGLDSREPTQDVARVLSGMCDGIMARTFEHEKVIKFAKYANVLYTDTWVSMGQEAEKQRRLKDFEGFSIDEKLLAEAPKKAVVLHCLPAYRGLEISEGVMEGKQSLVFPQAENRLHFQKGL